MPPALLASLATFFRHSPLRRRRYRAVYFGAIGAALGYTMQATVAAWLMVTITPSELMVSLVQSASTAPALVFGLIAGSLADILDRRRVVLATQMMLVGSTVLLGLTTLAGIVSPAWLLTVTFIIGTAFTFYVPAQQATINDLVPRAELSQAVSLSAAAFNVSRAVGPAIAGALVGLWSPGAALLVSAMLFLSMIVAMWKKNQHAPAHTGIPETLFSGVVIGIRFAWHSHALRSQIIRSVVFAVSASSLWALLPLLARDQFGLGAGGFGMLYGCFGAGAILGALSIPRLLRRMSLNLIIIRGTMLWGVAALLIASTTFVAVGIVGCFAAGAAWVGTLASVSTGTQSSAPAWVRARAVAMTFVSVQTTMAVTSPAWGALASLVGIRVTLAVAAATMLVLLGLTRKVRVELGQEEDVTATRVQLPDLAIAVPPEPDDGPVLIQIEYFVDAANRDAFLAAIKALEPMRRRNGASNWRVFRDLAEEGRYVERYIIDSWAEYVRLRARMTMTDRELLERVLELQRQDMPMRISRLIGLREDEEPEV